MGGRESAVIVRMEATGRTITIDGAEMQLWNGLTAGGVPCVVLVQRIVPRDGQFFYAFVQEMDFDDDKRACGWELKSRPL